MVAHADGRWLAEIDSFKWARSEWPSEADESVRNLLLSVLEGESGHWQALRGLSATLEQSRALEVFAHRQIENAQNRVDLLLAALATRIATTREAALVESKLTEKARTLGVSPRRLLRQATGILSAVSTESGADA